MLSLLSAIKKKTGDQKSEIISYIEFCNQYKVHKLSILYCSGDELLKKIIAFKVCPLSYMLCSMDSILHNV